MPAFPVCHWSAGDHSPYFNGGNRLHRGPLSGVVDGTSATISFHCHFPANGDQFIGLSKSTNIGLAEIGVSGGNLFCFFSRASVDDGAYEIYSTGVTLSEEAWHHVLLSFSATTVHLYIDGVDRLGTTAVHNDPLNFTSDQFVVGAAAANGRASLNGCLQDVFVEFNKFTDFSQAANRALFDRGTVSAGTSDVFLSGSPAAFETNHGAGGSFTRSGPAFTNCSNTITST